jgi:hypothetical protein
MWGFSTVFHSRVLHRIVKYDTLSGMQSKKVVELPHDPELCAKRLQDLYSRRQAVESLIRSLESYERCVSKDQAPKRS